MLVAASAALKSLLDPEGFHEDVDLAPDKLLDRLAHASDLVAGVYQLEGEILPLDVAEFAHALFERHPADERPAVGRRRADPQNSGRPCALAPQGHAAATPPKGRFKVSVRDYPGRSRSFSLDSSSARPIIISL